MQDNRFLYFLFGRGSSFICDILPALKDCPLGNLLTSLSRTVLFDWLFLITVENQNLEILEVASEASFSFERGALAEKR